jgi:hypothetical protein
MAQNQNVKKVLAIKLLQQLSHRQRKLPQALM